ncbi:MAG: VOC family protein, partial [Pseudomonadales bacterium]
MYEANLTRFGPSTVARPQGATASHTDTFIATAGPATLTLQLDGIDSAAVTINGTNVLDAVALRGAEAVVSVTLQRDNTIAVTLPEGPAATLGLRITQPAQADLKLLRQGYFGLNTSDMERQRKFYELLGFIGEIYPAGPETSTTFARSLGFEDDYHIFVSLHSLENPPTPPFVDTVQFRDEFYRAEPPYAHLNHLGMAYATYSTTNLDGDYAYLQSKGVEFVSPPATAPNGERFVFMKEQDGAFLKLIHVDGESKAGAPNLVRLENTNMNVADLERSREFYRLLGFTESWSGTQAGGAEFAAAHGFAEPIEFEGCDMTFGEGAERATLQLRQWRQPFDDTPSYPPPVNHLGIDRINFYVEDLTVVINTMEALGVKRLGPIGGSVELGIVFFFD